MPLRNYSIIRSTQRTEFYSRKTMRADFFIKILMETTSPERLKLMAFLINSLLTAYFRRVFGQFSESDITTIRRPEISASAGWNGLEIRITSRCLRASLSISIAPLMASVTGSTAMALQRNQDVPIIRMQTVTVRFRHLTQQRFSGFPQPAASENILMMKTDGSSF